MSALSRPPVFPPPLTPSCGVDGSQVKHRQELQQALEKAAAEHRESLERVIRNANDEAQTKTGAERAAVRCDGVQRTRARASRNYH